MKEMQYISPFVKKVEEVLDKGRPEWGAPDKDVFIIKLGRRIG